MSTIESIKLHLQPSHLTKLGKGVNVQLSHTQLHTALNGEPTAEIEMAKKHVTELLRAHRNKKGYRLMNAKIHGGKLNLKKIGRQISHVAKKVLGNPVVKRVSKELGHLAVASAHQYAANNDMNISGYANIAHKAIEAKNIKHDLQEQIGNDIVNYAHEQAGGKVRIPKGLRDFGNGFAKGFTGAMKNPIVQGVATNLITGAMMGAGTRKRKAPARRFVKGSVEAKQHMARLRSMRSGGALMPAGMSGGSDARKPLKYRLG